VANSGIIKNTSREIVMVKLATGESIPLRPGESYVARRLSEVEGLQDLKNKISVKESLNERKH